MCLSPFSYQLGAVEKAPSDWTIGFVGRNTLGAPPLNATSLPKARAKCASCFALALAARDQSISEAPSW